MNIDIENEDYYDNVGGYHSPCNCYNPKGYFCGDCTKLSCETCPYKDLEKGEDEVSTTSDMPIKKKIIDFSKNF